MLKCNCDRMAILSLRTEDYRMMAAAPLNRRPLILPIHFCISSITEMSPRISYCKKQGQGNISICTHSKHMFCFHFDMFRYPRVN